MALCMVVEGRLEGCCPRLRGPDLGEESSSPPFVLLHRGEARANRGARRKKRERSQARHFALPSLPSSLHSLNLPSFQSLEECRFNYFSSVTRGVRRIKKLKGEEWKRGKARSSVHPRPTHCLLLLPTWGSPDLPD
ncbi:unnamed protein product [Pleuronectes platessa]|uniref:Uncharacterized protein n=1 Tax=Pleuronectes platessa TaxID=8262 RepID=A0A9N7Z7B7_PLEPL|nr:unnamed protein product [Pleuronectes platessa]